MGEYSRRNFLKGSVVGLAAMAGAGALAGCAPKGAGSGGGAAKDGMTYADTAARARWPRAMRPKREPECF